MYKNWYEICKIQSAHFRLAVALSNDEFFLDKIAREFPELFLAEKSTHGGPFPLSYLQEVVKQNWEEPGDYSCGGDYLEDIGLPHILYAKDYGDLSDFPEGMVEREKEGIFLMPPGFYKETFPKLLRIAEDHGYFPFYLHEITIEGTRYYMGVPLSDYDDVVLFPVDLIDPNT